MKFFNFSKGKLNSEEFLASYGKSYKDILRTNLIPIASLCMVIAVTFFLGRLFHKIQPWFSIIQGLLILLFGLYCFWYAHRTSKILATSYRKAWSNYDFRFSIKAGIISIIVAPIAFFVASLKASCPYWVSVVLFILGFGLCCLGEYRLGFFKALGELGESDEEVRTDNSKSTDADYLGQTVGFSVVGLLYMGIFLPLTLWSAVTHSLDPVNVLLFTRLTEASVGLGVLGQLNTLLNFSNPSYLFAFGVFYGVAGIIVTLMKISIRNEGWLEISIISSGLVSGYALTIWIKHLLGAPLTSRLLFSSGFSFAYVFILYYGLRTILDVISRWGIRAKYEHLIGGIQSIGTAWILSRVFGDQSVVFYGVTFFICTFVTTSIFEATIGRLIKRMYTALPDLRAKSIVPAMLSMAREHHPVFWTSLRVTTIITAIFPFFAFGVAKIAILAL